MFLNIICAGCCVIICLDPPTINSLQSFYRVIEKQTLNVTCKADSNPQPYHIVWFPRGEAYDSSVLYFNPVSRNNSGNYTCPAKNNMTSMTGVERTGADTRWIEVDVLCKLCQSDNTIVKCCE